MNPLICLENLDLVYRYGWMRRRLKALDQFSLEVREGDFYALIGPNGAGKSSSMYCMLGLIKPASGTVRVMGAAPELGGLLFSQIGYVPEEPHYHEYLTVLEAVTFYGRLYGCKFSKTELALVLGKLGMESFADLKIEKCSKGMKQKVGLAQCLLRRPRLLFLDEPTRGLDPVMVREFRDILRDLHQSGVTIVMNTHVLSEVEMLANRVAVVQQGKVVLQDDLQNILRTETEEYTVVVQGMAASDYFKVTDSQASVLRGVIPADRLYDFMAQAASCQAKILKCSLKKSSLEDELIRILRQEKG
jgi:ABC-2 type transport system ATP-binding protein